MNMYKIVEYRRWLAGGDRLPKTTQGLKRHEKRVDKRLLAFMRIAEDGREWQYLPEKTI